MNNYNDGNYSEMPEEEKYNSNSINQKQGMGQEPSNPEEDMPEEERFFNDFTHPDIDNRDPSLGNNYIKIYEEEIPFEIRYENSNITEEDKSVFKSLVCKILTTDEMSQQINIKIEISNDSDLSFYYTTEINSSLFQKIKEEQKLTCDYTNFSDLLMKYFDFFNDNKKSYLGVLNIKNDKNAKMELMENLDYKIVELIYLDFTPAPQELISNQINYRYNSLRAVEDLMQNKVDIINNILKETDPQLIQEVRDEIARDNELNKSVSKKEKSIKNSQNNINK